MSLPFLHPLYLISPARLTHRYKEHNTRAKLGKLNVDKLVPEKEQRKTVANAIRALSNGQVS